MNKKIDISDVKIEWLSKRAIVLLSIFAHAAKKSEGHIIDLRAVNVLSQISDLVNASDNDELFDIYQHIKRAIKVSLSEENVSVETAQELAKLSAFDSAIKSQNRHRPH